MANTSPLLDLPVELLLSIFQYLDLHSFLNLTSTCRALHDPALVNDAQYWSTLLRTTFRVPNQPTIENDGERWRKLCKRFHTQTRVYTWGDNKHYCLGHSADAGGSRREALRRLRVSWPDQMVQIDDLGVISDLQCGGWSTTLLTAKGALYTVGLIDEQHARVQDTTSDRLPLRYPPGFPHPHDRYDSHTAIAQFSSGRAHILGLTDSGRIWSWQNTQHAALHVKFIHHDTIEDGTSFGRGVVKKVVAGWNKSAALIEGIGVVIWEPLSRNANELEIEDTALVLESVVVPKTGFVEEKTQGKMRRQAAGNPGKDLIGEVRNFIILEEVVVFNTHLGKVFAAQIFWNNRGQLVGKPVELELPASPTGEPAFATDVQGSYKSFGVFTKSGAVLTSKQDRLANLLQQITNPRELFTLIPALQDSHVIQLAFGDYHFHALHASGYITSYGQEPQRCGALGLGGHGSPDGRLRGIRYQSAGGDGRLIPHAYAKGRRIWFERKKRAWINFLTSGGVDPSEAQERIRLAIGVPGIQCQGEISEWVEQQGRDWEEKFGVQSEDGDDGLGPYYVLSITAAGWHSGALVLENAGLAERLSEACEIPAPVIPVQVPSSHVGSDGLIESRASLFSFALATAADWGRWTLGMPPYNVFSSTSRERNGAVVNISPYRRDMRPVDFGAAPRVGYMYKWANDHFPRLRLSDGTEMPGSVPFDTWRYDRPEWDVDFAF